MKVMIKFLYSFILLYSLLISLNAISESKDSKVIHGYLPDGSQIKIVNDKAYYYCRGKFLLLPDAAYLLSDGSLLTVENGKITELVIVNNKK